VALPVAEKKVYLAGFLDHSTETPVGGLLCPMQKASPIAKVTKDAIARRVARRYVIAMIPVASSPAVTKFHLSSRYAIWP
jgi:hypothetical protein